MGRNHPGALGADVLNLVGFPSFGAISVWVWKK